MQRRTALINEIRGFLLDRGLTFAARPIHLRKNLPSVIEDAEQKLSPRLRWLLDRMWQEWNQMEVDIKAITEAIERIGNENALCRRLRQIPGFGPLVSTATVAAIGNGAAFRRGRDFAAWLGVVPRQYSTGGKQKLFGMLELEPAKMRGRIDDAKTEIAARLEKLLDFPGLHKMEREAIEDALSGLRMLEREDEQGRADELEERKIDRLDSPS